VGFGPAAVRSSLAFGVVHGLGGTGHLLSVLPTLAFGPGGAALYLCGYLVAAIGWMSFVAGAAGIGLAEPRRARAAFGTAGLLAVGIGLYWVGAAVTA
jgi:hypothetical protein